MMSCFCTPKGKISNDLADFSFSRLETPTKGAKLIKMIVLGPSDAGKSTIIKQFQRLSDSSDQRSDIENMTAYIKGSIVMNMKTLCAQSLVLQHASDVEKPTTNRYVASLRDDMLSYRESNAFTSDIAFRVRQLWNDDLIQTTYAQLRHCFQLDENAEYFFNKLEAIAQDDYMPSFDDYVRMRKRSTGYSRSKFVKYIPNYGEYAFETLDVGGARSERKKWWDPNLLLDETLDAIIYVVPIADYDVCLFEDNRTNRLMEAIDLFTDTMIHGEFFKNKSLFVLFNKYDVYERKIRQVPITKCFDDFPVDQYDANDPSDGVRFIAGKFLQVFMDHNVELKGPLRIFRTNAVNTESIGKVFNKLCAHMLFRQRVEMLSNIC